MNFPATSRWLPVLLLLAGVAAYGNSLTGPFVFDDQVHIVDDGTIRRLWPPGPLVADTRRPVLKLSLAVNYALGSLDVVGYHLVNLAIHLAAGLTLFGLIRRTMQLAPQKAADTENADRLAFAVALLWLVHPLGTQSVTYIIQRAESLMGLFYLLSLYCLLRGSQAVRAWPWYTSAIAACWLGMGTKEVAITLLLVAPLYDRIYLTDAWRNVLRRRWAVYLGFFMAAVWLIAVTVHMSAQRKTTSAGFGLRDINWYEYLGTQGGVILRYLRLAVWPDRLCLDYWWPVAKSVQEIVLPGAVVAALVVASFVAIRYRPRLGFLGLSFILILAPTSSIMPIADPAMEHRMYLPLATVITLAVLGLHSLAVWLPSAPRVKPSVETCVVVVVAIALTARTIDRNHDYQNPIIMWNDVLASAPLNPRAHFGLGNALADADDLEQAALHYRRALDIKPDYADVHNNYAMLLKRQDKVDEAVDHCRQALRINPRLAQAHNNLGNLLALQGKLTEAGDHYRDALSDRPNYAEAHNNLGNLLQRQGRFLEAGDHYQQAIRFKADYAEAHANLGVVLQRQGDLAQAVVHLERALALRPDFAEAHLNLGNVLLRQGDDAGAKTHLEQALRLKPDLAQLHGIFGDLYRQQGNLSEAIAQYRQAVRLDPGLLPAAKSLAWILATCDDPTLRNGPEAVRWAERLAAATGHKDPAALDTLAAAYAEVGRYVEAVATAQTAFDLATVAGSDALARQIGHRLKLYRQQQPYRRPNRQP